MTETATEARSLIARRMVARARVWIRANRVDVVAVLLITVASFTIVGLHVRAYTEMEPDELSHVDGIVKWSRFEIIRRGDRVGQEAMREQACRGIDQRTQQLPPCESERFDPNDFQEFGQSLTHGNLPVYYMTTGVAARALRATGLVGSMVTSARLLGAVWLAAALVCIWFVGRELRIAPLAVAVGIGLIAVTPLTLHAAAVVNPDATLLLGGAAILLTALRWERGASPWWLFALVTVIALTVEWTAMLAVGLVAVFLAIRILNRCDDRRRLLLGTGAVVVVAAALVFAVPDLWRDAVGSTRQDISEPTRAQRESQHVAVELRREGLTNEFAWAQLDRLMTPLREAYRPAFLAKIPVTVSLRLTDWFLIGAVGGVIIAGARRSVPVALAVAAAALMLSGPLVELDIDRRYTVTYAVNARYGLPIVPALAVLAAWCANRRRGVLVGSGALAAFAFGAYLWAYATG